MVQGGTQIDVALVAVSKAAVQSTVLGSIYLLINYCFVLLREAGCVYVIENQLWTWVACHPLVGSFSVCDCGKGQKLRMKHNNRFGEGLLDSLCGVDESRSQSGPV